MFCSVESHLVCVNPKSLTSLDKSRASTHFLAFMSEGQEIYRHTETCIAFVCFRLSSTSSKIHKTLFCFPREFKHWYKRMTGLVLKVTVYMTQNCKDFVADPLVHLCDKIIINKLINIYK